MLLFLVLAVYPPCFNFYVVTRSYSSRPFLCAIAFTLIQIFVQQQVIHCMYDMHNTRPHPCMQPCKQGEWGEQVHLPHGSPFGFWRYSRLGCVTQNAKCPIFKFHILCFVYTVQPLDNDFITCVNIEHFGRKGFEKDVQHNYSITLAHTRPTMHHIRLV